MGSLSFLLIWLALMWGLVLRNGWLLTRMRHATVYGIHQILALLGLCLAVVHTAAQVFVAGGPVRVIDTFVPFANRLDPLGIGVGVVAIELMIASALSVLIQRKLGYSRWRALHALTYCAFLLMVAHVLLSGSDTGRVWAWGTVAGCLAVAGVFWSASTTWMAIARRRVQRSSSAAQRVRHSMVNVDAGRCSRFGFCEQAAPDVFKLRSDGRLSYRASISEDEIGAVVNAAEVCPVRAITLGRVPTSVLTPPRPPDPPEVDELSSRRRGGTVTGMRRRRSPR